VISYFQPCVCRLFRWPDGSFVNRPPDCH
jgi:hypothetical protein